MTATQVLTLAEFVAARLDEDETIARDASPHPWPHPDTYSLAVIDDDKWHYQIEIPKARVLADVAAKRAIVAAHEQVTEWGQGYEPDNGGTYGDMSSVCAVCGTADEYGVIWPCRTLRLLAAPFASHPDYRQEWAAG